jgi:hypothetical protein
MTEAREKRRLRRAIAELVGGVSWKGRVWWWCRVHDGVVGCSACAAVGVNELEIYCDQISRQEMARLTRVARGLPCSKVAS